MTGRELRKRRRDLELSQPQIARKLGVSTKTVCNWERRGHDPLPVVVGLACDSLLKTLEQAAKAAEKEIGR